MNREFHDEMALGNARDLLREMVEDGTECPCCRQFAKVYKRRIHSRMAADLIRFYRVHGQEWGHSTRTLGATAPDFVKLRYWNLVIPQEGEREDGSHRVGLWRISDEGWRWLHNGSTVMSHARLYDGRCLGFAGKPITIREALGKRFDYSELMAA